jgi:Mrp family chromosome partitioning ATPase
MSKYYGAITRPHRIEEQQLANTSILKKNEASEHSLVALPILDHVPAAVARANAIRNLTERLAPLAAVEKSTRLLLTGCRPGDGASTVATAIAIDISQRLGLRTMLVDAHLRHPSLHRLVQHPGRRTPELLLDGALQIRATEWPRLELVTCCVSSPDSYLELFDEFETLFSAYSSVIVDLGVVRLDARMVPLAKPADPILMVVRQGHTERRELATTASALRTANRSVAGVILNDAIDPVAKPLRRLLGR